jgi:RimJ/RimL family protein N-acetyltransferase
MAVDTLVGKHVSLQPIGDGDLAAIEPWLSEAVEAAGRPLPFPLSRPAGEGRSVDPRSNRVLVIEREDESEPIGIVEYETTEGWLTVAFIALAKAYRGWGYGSEAVRLLEAWALRERLAGWFWAEVAVGNGLALYFWLRLGYRPEGPEDAGGWRGERERDRMRMVRYANDEGVRG